MKKLLAISILGILCYYGVMYYNYMNNGVTYVDPNLETLVEEWKSEMEEHGLDWKDKYSRIRRIDLVSDYGVKHIAGHADHTNRKLGIGVEQVFKGRYTTSAVLWHELGHFVFGLEHQDGISIMNSETKEEEYYKENWEELKTNYINQIKDGI